MERHKRNTEYTSFSQEGEYTLGCDAPVEAPQQGIEETDEVVNSELYPTWHRLK